MSIRTMIFKGGHHVTVKYKSETIGAGAQITRTMKVRYANLPARRRELSAREKALLYDKEKVDADSIFYVMHVDGIRNSDEVYDGAERFVILKVTEADMLGKFLAISVKRVD